jgi:GT2 family glycosyltransferase
MTEIIVAMACHNRVEATLNCLRQLAVQDVDHGTKLRTIVVDDGSTDGTSHRVAREFPDVTVLQGDGTLFWNRGMHLACSKAIEHQSEFILWLNDDTYLYPNGVSELLRTYDILAGKGDRKLIVVGAVRDPERNCLTYGGWRSQSKLNPAACSRIDMVDRPTECETMNGNCVLISREAFLATGNLDVVFSHAMGDFDYGFRARSAGCQIWIAKGFVGECHINDGKGLWSDKSLSWRERWRRMMGPKGLPPREWFVYTRRHSGLFWPIFWINPYVRMLWTGVQQCFALGRERHAKN